MSLVNGLVSVIVPVFNGATTINRAIRSLLYQSYTKWECIIINDGSTDGTLDVLRPFLKDEARIKLYSFDENCGRSYARQKGLELASGEFLAMLDSDDFYHPSKLEVQVRCFHENKNIALVGCGLISFGLDINFITSRGGVDSGKFSYMGKVEMPHAPSMLKTDIAKKYAYNTKLNLGEDVDYLSRYLVGKSYYMLPEYLYYYSEFDSVSLPKIREAYLNEFRAYYATSIKKALNNLLKFSLSCIVHPLIGHTRVLKRRGKLGSSSEYLQFKELLTQLEDFEKP